MTVVYLTSAQSDRRLRSEGDTRITGSSRLPTLTSLKADTGSPRKSHDFLGLGALPLKADVLPLSEDRNPLIGAGLQSAPTLWHRHLKAPTPTPPQGQRWGRAHLPLREN